MSFSVAFERDSSAIQRTRLAASRDQGNRCCPAPRAIATLLMAIKRGARRRAAQRPAARTSAHRSRSSAAAARARRIAIERPRRNRA
jgi:hypothetical protein